MGDITYDERDPRGRDQRKASAPAVARALVYVSVRGGIADSWTVRGDVDVVLIDWDNVEDDENEELIREYLATAKEFLADWGEANDIIPDLEERLEEIEEYRSERD